MEKKRRMSETYFADVREVEEKGEAMIKTENK